MGKNRLEAFRDGVLAIMAPDISAKQAIKDANEIVASGLTTKSQALLEILAVDAQQNPLRNEQLAGDFFGPYPRRINFQKCSPHGHTHLRCAASQW